MSNPGPSAKASGRTRIATPTVSRRSDHVGNGNPLERIDLATPGLGGSTDREAEHFQRGPRTSDDRSAAAASVRPHRNIPRANPGAGQFPLRPRSGTFYLSPDLAQRSWAGRRRAAVPQSSHGRLRFRASWYASCVRDLGPSTVPRTEARPMDAVYRDRPLARTPGEEAWRAKEQGRECRNRICRERKRNRSHHGPRCQTVRCPKC